MDLFTYLMNKNGNNAPGDLFSSLLGKGQNGTYQTFTGTSINANNTKKGKMKLSLYGNTEQDTTTGKNIIRYPYDATSGKYANVNVTINNDGSVTLNGTGNNTGYINLVSYDNKMHLVAGTYTLSKNVGVECSINDGTNTLAYISRTQTSATFTITEAKDIQLFFAVRSEIAYNVTVYPMLEIGSSATEWEKPTNGASPNPSYPQPIHTISVDNEVVISGSQLFDASKHIVLSSNGITATINNGEIILNGTATATAYIGFHLNNTIPSGTIVSYGANNSSTMAQCYLNLVLDNATKEVVQMNTQNCKRENITLSSDINGVYIQIGNGITLNNFKIKPMLNIGATLREYEPYQSQTYPINLPDGMFLGWIGDYKDRFLRNSGKNMFNPSLIEEYTTSTGITITHNSNGEIVLNGTASAQTNLNTPKLDIPTGTEKISISGGSSSVSYAYITYTSDDTYIGTSRDSGTPQTYTLPSNASKCEINIRIASGTSLTNFVVNAMFSESDTPLPYEPYGNGDWYLKKHIGKVVLDGSEAGWRLFFETSGIFINSSILTSIDSASTTNCKSNYYTGTDRTYIRGNLGTANNVCATNNTELIFANKSLSTASDFTTWLSSNNTSIYYVLETPTYTKIEGTLAEQLEDIYNETMSYQSQTNISQVNNDLAFELEAEIKVKS